MGAFAGASSYFWGGLGAISRKLALGAFCWRIICCVVGAVWVSPLANLLCVRLLAHPTVFRSPNFFKISGKISTAAGAPNVGVIALTVPRFGRPERGFRRLGPNVAKIEPLLPRFCPKSGRSEIMAGWPVFLRNPDFLKKSGQISKSAAAPISGANHLVSDSFWPPELELRPALARCRQNRGAI